MTTLPSKITLGGHNIKVKHELFKERTDLLGQAVYTEGTIQVAPVYDSIPVIDSVQHTTFLHEIIHMIDHIYCCRDNKTRVIDEDIVCGLAQGLYQLLRNNDLGFIYKGNHRHDKRKQNNTLPRKEKRKGLQKV